MLVHITFTLCDLNERNIISTILLVTVENELDFKTKN